MFLFCKHSSKRNKIKKQKNIPKILFLCIKVLTCTRFLKIEK